MGRNYRHLCFEERALIETQLRMGLSPAAIAVGLMRARSTVLREMRRNGWQSDFELARLSRHRIAGGYRSIVADRRARHLAVKPRIVRKLAAESQLWVLVMDYLRQGLSPAQIASTLARMPEPVQLSYETIYTALYTMPRGELRSLLMPHLRRKHRARRAQHKTDGRRKPSIPEMVLIDQRPVEIQMRLIPGHWEGDLIIGKGNLSQVGTLVERTTLFVALVQLDSTKADVTAVLTQKAHSARKTFSAIGLASGKRHIRQSAGIQLDPDEQAGRKEMPSSRPRNPASRVVRFENMPNRMAASSGATKIEKSACT